MHSSEETLLAAATLYGTLWLGGLGPARLLLGRSAGGLAVAAFAPVLGLAVALFLVTAAIELDLPIGACAGVLATALLASSAVMFALAGRGRPAAPETGNATPVGGDAPLCAATILAAAVLLLAPAALGGPGATTLRGNLYDDLNYIIGARYFDSHPLSWQARMAPSDLVAIDPSLALVKRFLWSERTPIVGLLAWAARLTTLPIVRVEFAFTLVFFLVAVGPAFLWCASLGAAAPVRLLAPLAVACGFWAQIVLDLRAMGQIVNLPLSLGLSWAVLRSLTSCRTATSGREVVLLTFLSAAAALSYPEIVPGLLLGIGGALALALVPGNPESRVRLRTWGLVALGTLLLLASQRTFFWTFLVRQIDACLTRGADMRWEGDWFRFLSTPCPLQGYWGLAWGGLCSASWSKVLGTALALLLSVTAIALAAESLGRTLASRRRAALPEPSASRALWLLASFGLGFAAQDIALRWLGNPWAGAKAISYGYPYFTLLIAAALSPRLAPSAFPRWARGLMGGGAALWLAAQLTFAIGRMEHARDGTTWFVVGDPQHRSSVSVGYDRDWLGFRQALSSLGNERVWSFQPNVWEQELFSVSFGDDAKLTPLLSIDHYQTEFLIGRPEAARLPLPRYLLVDRRFWGDQVVPGETVVHESARTRLLRLSADAWTTPRLFGVWSRKSEVLFRGTNTAPVTLPCEIWLHSPKAAVLRLSLSGAGSRVSVSSAAGSPSLPWQGTITGGVTIEMPLSKGLNVYRLAAASLHGPVDLEAVVWSGADRTASLF